MLHAVAHHMACARCDASNSAAIDFTPRKLMRAAEKRIRRASNFQVPAIGQRFQFETLRHRQDKRLSE